MIARTPACWPGNILLVDKGYRSARIRGAWRHVRSGFVIVRGKRQDVRCRRPAGIIRIGEYCIAGLRAGVGHSRSFRFCKYPIGCIIHDYWRVIKIQLYSNAGRYVFAGR